MQPSENLTFRVKLNTLYVFKSKFDFEYRRFCLLGSEIPCFVEFVHRILLIHGIGENTIIEETEKHVSFEIFYKDVSSNNCLQITNDENYARALNVSQPPINIILKTRDVEQINGFQNSPKKLIISKPTDFRTVSCLFDNGYLPDSFIRVRLCKNEHEKRLIGIYIRGESSKANNNHMNDCNPEVLRIFVSRIEPGSIAEACGVIFVGDEIVEVNGITLDDKEMDQVVELMVVNCSNLILTLRSGQISNSNFLRGDTFRGSFYKSSRLRNNVHQPVIFNV